MGPPKIPTLGFCRTSVNYPMALLNVNNVFLGTALTSSQVVSLWNADAANSAIGTLAVSPGNQYQFTITLLGNQSSPVCIKALNVMQNEDNSFITNEDGSLMLNEDQNIN